MEQFKGFQQEEEKKQFFDHMNMKENKEITDQLDDKERIIFSILTKKKNKWGRNQGRTICITDKHVYVFGGKNPTMHRKIDISSICGFTKGTECDDFIIHVKNEYDTQFTSSQIDNILECLTYAFAAVTQ